MCCQYVWLNVNRLSLNINKTRYVIFHPFNKSLKHQIKKIHNIAISQKAHIKYLGVNRLNLKLEATNKKYVAKYLGPFLNPTMMKNIYLALFILIVYTIEVWGSAGKN